jgi:transcriptional regulator MraZ
MAVFIGFTGEFTHTLDTKGRLALPARYRSRFEAGAVVTPGVEACLYVYPMEAWEAKARQIDEKNLNAAQRRQVERRFFGNASELELDSQGRVIIPAKYRERAGLENDVLIVGARDRLELWNMAQYRETLAQMQPADLEGLDLPF